MEEFLLSSIISLLTEVEKNAFLGVKGKIRLFRLKKQLRREIFERILKRVCFDERAKDITPVFFALKEYGKIYESIRTGIMDKIGHFCTGNVEKYIDYLLINKKIALIFDGIDGPEEHYGFKQTPHKHYIFKTANARGLIIERPW